MSTTMPGTMPRWGPGVNEHKTREKNHTAPRAAGAMTELFARHLGTLKRWTLSPSL